MDTTNAASVNFDRAADFYDATRGFPLEQETPIAQFIAAVGMLTPTSEVLEIGIGTGRIALPLARLVERYYGVDLSTEMMARLRQKQTNQSIWLAEADASRLPFPNACVDAAVVVHVLHLVSDRTAVLNELRRVLRPGGRLIHCWNRGEDGALVTVREAWRTVVESNPRGRMESNNFDTTIQEAGWRADGDIYEHPYTITAIPENTVTGFANRIWSATWELSDEDHARGLAAMQAALAEHFPNPAAPVQINTAFQLRLYAPLVD